MHFITFIVFLCFVFQWALLVHSLSSSEDIIQDDSYIDQDEAEVLLEIMEAQRLEEEEALREETLIKEEAASSEPKSTLSQQFSQSENESTPKAKFDGKPRSTLKASKAASSAGKKDFKPNRDRVPGGAKGKGAEVPLHKNDANYFTQKKASGGKNKKRKTEGNHVPVNTEPVDADRVAREKASRDEVAKLLAEEARLSTRRKYARPVEKIMRHVKESAKFRDHYKILDLSPHASLKQIKKQFRETVLTVHPDKNSHPDAKMAFDVLHEAFETLSTASLRSSFDVARRRRHRLASDPKTKILVFLRSNKWESLVSALWRRPRDEFERLRKRFVYCPSLWDRILLLNEIFIENFSSIAAVSMLIAFLL